MYAVCDKLSVVNIFNTNTWLINLKDKNTINNNLIVYKLFQKQGFHLRVCITYSKNSLFVYCNWGLKNKRYIGKPHGECLSGFLKGPTTQRSWYQGTHRRTKQGRLFKATTNTYRTYWLLAYNCLPPNSLPHNSKAWLLCFWESRNNLIVDRWLIPMPLTPLQ